MNAVQLEVGKALLGHLKGFRKAPVGDGFNRFAEVLCESSISVEHATAVVESFDTEFPTLRDIRDTAYNLRPKFEAKTDQKKEWEAKYGKPDPAWSDRFAEKAAGMTATMDPNLRKAQHVEEMRCVLWQAIRDSLYYTEGPGARGPDQFWHTAADNHKRNHPAEVAAFRRQLQESGWDVLMAVDWQKSMPAAPARSATPVPALAHPITAEDVSRELRAQGREAGDGE